MHSSVRTFPLHKDKYPMNFIPSTAPIHKFCFSGMKKEYACITRRQKRINTKQRYDELSPQPLHEILQLRWIPTNVIVHDVRHLRRKEGPGENHDRLHAFVILPSPCARCVCSCVGLVGWF